MNRVTPTGPPFTAELNGARRRYDEPAHDVTIPGAVPTSGNDGNDGVDGDDGGGNGGGYLHVAVDDAVDDAVDEGGDGDGDGGAGGLEQSYTERAGVLCCIPPAPPRVHPPWVHDR